MKDAFKIFCNIVAIILIMVGSYQGGLGNYAQGTFLLVAALLLTSNN